MYLIVGRVNLIGEHIDYEDYSVLLMVISPDTIVAIRKHDDDSQKLLRIANVSDKYSLCTYPANPNQVWVLFINNCVFLSMLCVDDFKSYVLGNSCAKPLLIVTVVIT